MMIQFTVVLTAFFLAMTGINADHTGPGGFGGLGGGLDESDLKDLGACTETSANKPKCAVGNGELGTWLCRTDVEPLTGESDSWSTCGNATRALPLDECGCCGDVCPGECACGCPLEGVADAGVLVTMVRPSGEGNEKCLAPEKAISLIAMPGGHLECVIVCPVVP
jgi:hypothetical protein